MNPVFLSHFLDENTPIYGGIPDTISFSSISSINQGDTANSLKIGFPNHVGTHLDFPFHFNNNGKNSSDYSADFWIFRKVINELCKANCVEYIIMVYNINRIFMTRFE